MATAVARHIGIAQVVRALLALSSLDDSTRSPRLCVSSLRGNNQPLAPFIRQSARLWIAIANSARLKPGDKSESTI